MQLENHFSLINLDIYNKENIMEEKNVIVDLIAFVDAKIKNKQSYDCFLMHKKRDFISCMVHNQLYYIMYKKNILYFYKKYF